MQYRRLRRHYARGANSAVFEVAFHPVTSKWSALREATPEILSEHASESEAHATCCRSDAALRRRMNTQPLADLAHRAL
jgi:hypothetical protein